jgi:hypothetical protein
VGLWVGPWVGLWGDAGKMSMDGELGGSEMPGSLFKSHDAYKWRWETLFIDQALQLYLAVPQGLAFNPSCTPPLVRPPMTPNLPPSSIVSGDGGTSPLTQHLPPPRVIISSPILRRNLFSPFTTLGACFVPSRNLL